MIYNRMVTLEEISSELSDGLHKAPAFVEGGEYIFVNAKNLVNGRIEDNDPSKHTTYEEFCKYASPVNERTILYSIDGTIGNIAKYRNEKCVLGKGACYINVRDDVLLDYIYYILQSPDFNNYIQSMSTGSTIKHISLKTMRNYRFYLPEYAIQKESVEILRALDEKIELNNQINENLQQQAQAIYQHMFGITEDRPANGVLSDICSLSAEKVDVSKLSLENYYSTENMLPNKGGAVVATALPSVAQTTKSRPGDTLISNIRPYFKKILYCTKEGGCSTDVLCFRPKRPELATYLYNTLYNDRFFDYMMAGAKGTKMPRGDKQQIKRFFISIPNNKELKYYNDTSTVLLNNVISRNAENDILGKVRDELLSKLFS